MADEVKIVFPLQQTFESDIVKEEMDEEMNEILNDVKDDSSALLR